MDDPLILALTVLLTAEAALAIWSALRMRRRYGRRLVESVMWDRLIASQFRAVVAGLLMLVVTLYGLVGFALGWAPLPRPWSALLVSGALALLLWGPISDWWMLKRIDRGGWSVEEDEASASVHERRAS